VFPLAPATLAAQQKPPTPAEQDALAAKYLTLDDTTAEGHAAQTAILARLHDVPTLTPAQVTAWKTKLQKLHKKGRKLETTGDNWFVAGDDKKQLAPRGRYIVGGETKKPKGLAIAMHGGGTGSGDASTAASAYDAALKKLGLLMIAPEVLEKTECGWTDAGSEEFVLELVDGALRTWKLDPDQTVFVGHSMGGYGSWTLGAHHADRVAAVAPSAGAPTGIRASATGPITQLVEGVIPSLRNVFVSIYQSLDDPNVPPDSNQAAVKFLTAAGTKWGAFEHEYWEVDGRGHAEPPGGFGVHVAKITARRRQPVPERIVWQPVLSWKRQFYWLAWDSPVKHAIVVADLDRSANAVTITCDRRTAGLRVLLDERVLDVQREVVVTVNGVETFRGKVAPSLTTLLQTSGHPDEDLVFVAAVPAAEPEAR
jgi:poly(3-hydroxybutyrate) depolymerase